MRRRPADCSPRSPRPNINFEGLQVASEFDLFKTGVEAPAIRRDGRHYIDYQHIRSQAALVRVALLEAITLMSSFQELTNDLAPSS